MNIYIYIYIYIYLPGIWTVAQPGKKLWKTSCSFALSFPLIIIIIIINKITCCLRLSLS